MTHFAGTAEMVWLVLRRDRLRLTIWVLAIVGLIYVTAVAVAETYSSPDQIRAYANSVGASPTAAALAGPPIALTTVGGILVYETSLTALVGVALMAVFLTIRHTRGDEDEGRTELLRSTVVGRYAHNSATLLVVTAASVVIGAGVTASLLTVEGVAAAGAVLYGASVAVFGVVLAAVASVAAQVMSHRRTAIGVSLTVLGVFYLLRAVGDVAENGLSWLSPMGWSQQVSSFEENRWWPLLPSVVLTVVLVVAAAWLVTRRDLGSGLVPPRPGSPNASRLLAGPIGLTFRLQRGSIVGWGIGVFAFGAIMGSFSQELLDMVENNPLMAEFFAATGTSITDTYFSFMLLLMAVLVSAFGVASALRLRGEETSGRVEPLLATPVSRVRWLLGGLSVTLLGSVALLAASGLGIGVAHAIVSDDAGVALPLVADAMVHLPAVLLVTSVVVLLIGVMPRRSLLAWVGVAYAFVLAYLGPLLDPPQWLLNTSPFSHSPQVPAESVTATPLVAMSALMVVVVLLGLLGMRRRDLA